MGQDLVHLQGSICIWVSDQDDKISHLKDVGPNILIVLGYEKREKPHFTEHPRLPLHPSSSYECLQST